MLKLAHLNVRSLFNKLDEVLNLACTFDLDVLAITETWLGPNVDDGLIKLNNYRCVRRDRDGLSGGVAIYLRNAIKFKVVPSDSFSFLEQLWLEISFGGKKYMAGVFYRPPSTNINDFLTHFDEVLSNMFLLSDEMFLAGDLNINLLNDNLHVVKFHSIIHTYNLCQIVDKPTRTTGTTSTLLDVIILSQSFKTVESNVYDVNEISDHCMVRAIIESANQPRAITVRRFRSFRNFNYESFDSYLRTLNWDEIYSKSNIDDMVKIVQANIFNVFDMHAPYVIVSTAAKRRRSPWITDNIKYLQSLRDAALRKFKRTRLPEHWDYYKQLRNYTTTAIKAEKKAYLEFRVTHAGGRTMWRELRNLNVYSSKQFTIPSDLRNANMLNTHFSQVSARAGSVDDVALLFYSSKRRPGVDTFEFEQVTEDLVANVINGITSNSIGIDGISRKMIILRGPFLIPYIFNFCLHYGI